MRILFSSMDLEAHLGPMVPLATAATASGHDVVIASGPRAVRDTMVPGMDVRAVAGSLDPARYETLARRDHVDRLTADERLAHLVTAGLIEARAPEVADALFALARSWRPDVIVSNAAEHGATLVAGRLGLPLVVHGFGPPRPASDADMIDAALTDAYRRWRGRADVRLPSWRDHLLIDIWPSSIAPPGQPLHHRSVPMAPAHVALGPVRRRSHAVSRLRHVYVTAGTTHNRRPGYLETLVAGAARAGRQVTVTLGSGRSWETSRRADVSVFDYLPQREALASADIVVCHGGAGTVLGALSASTGLVIVPLAADHHTIAQLVVDSGAGVQVGRLEGREPEQRDDRVADAVDAAINQLLASESHATAARVIADEIASRPSPDAAMRALERELSAGI